MAISTAFPTSFKVELGKAVHNFTASTGHTFKIALFKASVSGTFDAATTNYSAMSTDEHAAGNGYTTGGATLTSATPVASGTSAIFDFTDNTWANATISSDGCLIYNSSASDAAVYVGSFGSTKSSTNGNFTIQFPTPAAGTSILEIA